MMIKERSGQKVRLTGPVEKRMELKFNAFSSMNPLIFGKGVIALAGEKLKEAGCTKVMAVYDKGIKAAGIVDKVLKPIEDAGIEIVVFDEVQLNPPDWSAEAAGKVGLEAEIDGIVAIGGGSSLDTAKAAKMLQSNPLPLRQYLGLPPKPHTPNNIFLLVVPTTAGTGSEATPGGVITDTVNNEKLPAGGPGWSVNLGLVDPELTYCLPASITAATGVDAFCHAVDSYTSTMTNAYSEVFALEALRLIGKYLVRVVQDGSDEEARIGMMKAATFAGVSTNGGGHFTHGIGEPLGNKFHLTHGVACGSLTPQILEYVAQAWPDRIAQVATCFGASVPEGATPEEIGKIMKETLLDVFKEINFPTLSSFGMEKQELLDVTSDAVAQTLCMCPPMPVTEEAVRKILEDTYDVKY